MHRRDVLKSSGGIIGLGVLGVTPAVVRGQGPPEHPPGATNDRGNWIRGRAEELNVTEVLEQTANPSAPNFEEAFTFYRVTYGDVTFDTWVYREPARLGGGNFVLENLGGLTQNRSWLGVSAPDGDGIQHEIVHQGQVSQYFETDDGWMSLIAQFDGHGDLQEVNGVSPE